MASTDCTIEDDEGDDHNGEVQTVDGIESVFHAIIVSDDHRALAVAKSIPDQVDVVL